MENRKIVLRDTTLREGIQMPNSRITPGQKHAFITFLEKINVPEIEIGLPDGVTACLEVANWIRQQGYSIRSTALIPCYTDRWRKQIGLAAENGIHGIDILAPASDHLLSDPSLYGLTSDKILPRLEEVIACARQTSLRIGVGFIDATRTPEDRLLRFVEPLKALGVLRLVIYDSVGIMLPSRFKPLVASIRKTSGLDVLVHCHNDYGMATANSLAAVEGGATAVDVAVNGLGGRAGNAALEEVALALENLYGLRTGIDTRHFKGLAAFTEVMTELKNSPLKPVVGDYCFAHLPVMHIRCIAGGNPSAFEPFPPEQVGSRRIYDFSLPVDYSAALEPFIRKSGCQPTPEEIGRILDHLKQSKGNTEDEVIELIRANSIKQ